MRKEIFLIIEIECDYIYFLNYYIKFNSFLKINIYKNFFWMRAEFYVYSEINFKKNL